MFSRFDHIPDFSRVEIPHRLTSSSEMKGPAAEEDAATTRIAEWKRPDASRWLPAPAWVMALGIPVSLLGGYISPYLPFHLVLLVFLKAPSGRFLWSPFPKRTEKLIDIPAPSKAYPCTVAISYEGREVGQDDGLVNFLDGVFYFHGLHTMFNLRSRDVKLDAEQRAVGAYALKGRLPGGERFEVWVYLQGSRIDNVTGREFREQVRQFTHTRSKTVGHSIYPPPEKWTSHALRLDAISERLCWVTASVALGYLAGRWRTHDVRFAWAVIVILAIEALVVAYAFVSNRQRGRRIDSLAAKLRASVDHHGEPVQIPETVTVLAESFDPRGVHQGGPLL